MTNIVQLELLISKLKDFKNITQQFAYLKKFVGPTQVKTLKANPDEKDQLIVFAESAESANHVVDNEVGDILSKMGSKNVQEIHITDQKTYNNL